jgi:hypothetical protein
MPCLQIAAQLAVRVCNTESLQLLFHDSSELFVGGPF